MSSEIEWNGYDVEYTYGDESYVIDDVSSISVKHHQEKSAGHQEPDDDVVTEVFSADTEHGEFRWSVTARRSGFESSAEIEDVEVLQEPEGCDAESPSFTITG